MDVKSLLKCLAKKSVLAQRFYLAYRKHQQKQFLPDWGAILPKDQSQWQNAIESAKQGQKILLATSIGAHPSAPIMDSLLAAALTLRGAEVHFLLCDSFLPACQMAVISVMSPADFGRYGPQKYLCKGCFERAKEIYAPLGLKVHRYSEFVTTDELKTTAELSSKVAFEDIPRYTVDGIAVGEQVMAGALRYFARPSLRGCPGAESVLRRYLSAAILSAYAVRGLLKSQAFNVVYVNHGIYVPHGIVAEVSRVEGRRLVAWNVAYRKRSFIFSHTDTYHHTLMSEPVSEWANLPWNIKLETEAIDYLASREKGGRDWIMFHDRNAADNLGKVLPEVKASGKPIIGMLTNVSWDAQLHYPANAFSNMMDWVLKTVKYFASRPDLYLVIRVHPAEISGDVPSRQPVVAEILKEFPVLPDNIILVGPESKVSTYKIAELCNAVIIYGTKTGVELASRGVPVVVAGEAWIRNKGLTIDAKSEEDYFNILARLPLPERMPKDQVRKACKYAYHFFFRRMIPISVLEPTGGELQFRMNIDSINDILPGKSPGLDIICDGILKGTPFIYPAEKIDDHKVS